MSKATWRTFAIVLCALFGTALSSIAFAQDRPPQGPPAPGRQAPRLPSQASETRLGMWRGRPVAYQVINGRNVYQGDIILENVEPMPQAGGVHPASVGLANSNFLWDKVNGVAQIPYVIEPTSGDQPNIQAAISIYNATFAGVIQFVPRASQANYIDINLFDRPNGSCEAQEGDAHQGEQFVNGATNCTIATILHEFGHVTGVWHEQSRTDASTYVTFNEANVIKGSIGNFLPAVDNDQQNLGFYDYASVMEYPAFSFSRNGGPPLDSIPPGMPLSNLVGYSAADVEGIMRLYGVAPTEVTVTSNPLGLQVLVDGSPVTTPMTFNWNLGSMHTLAVAAGVQTVNGVIVASSNPQEPTTFYYEYGRWNDGQPQSHSITVMPGNGDAGFPVSAPQVATYTANFIQLVPYTPSVFPSGSGSVVLTGTPAPQNITVNGTPGTYVLARQQATLTATANSGFSFYEFNNGPLWLAGGLGSNPKTFYVPETGLTVNPSVEFTNMPVYTIDVTPNSFSSNLGVLVDGGFWDVPKNFSPDPALDGSAWASGTMHTLQFSTPQGPFSVNTQFAFSSWTPGGTANPLSITLPAASQSYIATILPEYVPATNFNFPPCGGTAAITPASTITGGFYPSGTTLTYTETPATTTPPGQWIFTGWTFDLTGTTNPDTLSPTDESLVYANFNTTTAPLTITSLSPSTIASGGSAFTLTINGTGFTPASNVGINFPSIFLTPIFVSSTELQVTVPASDIATPATFLVFVENFPSSGGCAVFADQPFFVNQGTPSGATTVTATPTTLSFASTVVDQTSAGQTITVKNTGSTATTVAITASTNFGQTNSCPVAPATLAGGATCTITATFAPVTSGALTGNIAVTDSAANSPQTVTLSGTATAALTTVTTNPNSLAFGSQNVGTTSVGQTFTVQNTGSASTSVAIAASANYAQINNCGTLLQIGTSCTVTVSFTPTANGSLPGSISITDSAANSPQVVTLSGTGTSGGTVTVTVTPSSETFPAQTVGTTSAAKVVTVKNTGTLSTTISVGPATGDFTQTNTCGSTLNAGASCTVSVKFTPTQVGTRTGAVSITDQASNSPQSIGLTGTGKATTVTVTPAAETFTAQAVGATSLAKVVTVKNTGTAQTTISVSPASGGFAQNNTCGSTLNAGATCTISVTFTPATTGSIPGVITVSDTASNSPQIVGLTGTGVAPVTFSAASLAFGSEPVGSTATAKTVTMTNNMSSTLTGISIAASGNYSTTGGGTTCTGTLAGSAHCTISVTFAPTANGSIDGAVTVAYGAAYSPQEVKLTGTGTGGTTSPLKFTPASLAFTSQAVGTTSAGKTVTVQNTSASAVTLSSIATSGNFTAVGGTTTPCSNTSVLAPSGSCTLSVTFTPSIAGAIQGALVISDNNVMVGQQVVNLTGTALLPVTIAPASLTFASQAVGSTSSPQILTVTNNSGSMPLTSLSFAGSVDFSVTAGGTAPCGTSLAVGAKCTLSVTFTPSRTGSIQGAATITGSNNTLLVTKLTGTGS